MLIRKCNIDLWNAYKTNIWKSGLFCTGHHFLFWKVNRNCITNSRAELTCFGPLLTSKNNTREDDLCKSVHVSKCYIFTTLEVDCYWAGLYFNRIFPVMSYFVKKESIRCEKHYYFFLEDKQKKIGEIGFHHIHSSLHSVSTSSIRSLDLARAKEIV